MIGGDGGGGWRKSTSSGANGCVEVQVQEQLNGYEIHVRDSKHGTGSQVLRFTFTEWAAFLDGVKAGEFDLPGGDGGGGCPASSGSSSPPRSA